MIRRAAAAWLPMPLLAACMTPPPPAPPARAVPPDLHVPDYAKRPDEPFSRVNAVAIAQREWRAFGMLVDDNPPGSVPLAQRWDRDPGLWQRVGDYWWFGQDAGTPASTWTGRYNEFGAEYPGAAPAWSAAFISYIMRAAGAGARFPYSPLHADYINAAARNEGVVHAEPPDSYAPQQGDLICYGRLDARTLRFEDLPTSRFFGHCDIIIQAGPGQLTVIGGNVASGVTMKHVPVTTAGTLSGPGGVLDSRYNWFVVLRVSYDQ